MGRMGGGEDLEGGGGGGVEAGERLESECKIHPSQLNCSKQLAHFTQPST
jgi:hypothetical protein